MAIKSKVQKVIKLPSIAMAATTEICQVQEIGGMHNFSVAVMTSATAALTYTISTAPEPNAVWTEITATSVGASAKSITVNTIDNNNMPWLKVTFSNTSSLTLASGITFVYVCYNER